ncbi:hypothetical protein ACHAWC_011503 [Mediolabrus comicus]
MNTRRLPARAAAEHNVDRSDQIDSKSDDDKKGSATNIGKVSASTLPLSVQKKEKDGDDQTATTCNETPATEEKKEAVKKHVSRADFHPMNPSTAGVQPPNAYMNAMPTPHANVYGYPGYPTPMGAVPPPLPPYLPPGSVPSTVHMPFPASHMSFPTSQISPLQVQQSLKNGGNKKKSEPEKDPLSNPATPRNASVKESEAAVAMLGCATDNSPNAKPSPLDLLSTVSSSSPTAKSKKNGHETTLPPLPNGVAAEAAAVAQSYKYPPPPEQMDVNNFHCFPQTGPHFSQDDEYPLPPISATFGSDDDFNPDTPSSRHSSIGDVLNAANVVERTESTIKSAKRRYGSGFSDRSSKRRKTPNTAKTEGSDLFSISRFPPGTSFTNPPSLGSASKLMSPEVTSQAEKACMLAQQALENPYIGKQLLLSMAMVRINPRSPPSSYPAHGTVLSDRFHWASFPPLDTILRKNMERYYELSTQKCQSKDQQDFNNALVDQVKAEAHKYGWEFDRKAFDDKKIRDRIRCFFKTHIQNAKKRLKTMLRNPSKKANIKALSDHFHLIEEKNKMQPPKKDDHDDERGVVEQRKEMRASTSNVGDVSSEFTLAALPGNRHVKEKREVAAYSEV